jgi:hypothetical protein
LQEEPVLLQEQFVAAAVTEGEIDFICLGGR